MKPGDKLKIVFGPLKGTKAEFVREANIKEADVRLSDGRIARVNYNDFALEWSTFRKVGTVLALVMGAIFCGIALKDKTLLQ